MTSCYNNNTTTVLRPFVQDYRVSQYQKKHSPTHYPDHHRIFISFLHLPRSLASSLLKLHAWQSFCTTCLDVIFGLPFISDIAIFVLKRDVKLQLTFAYLLVWSPPPHIPYISSPNQCLLFVAHPHTIATCFAVVPIYKNRKRLSVGLCHGLSKH